MNVIKDLIHLIVCLRVCVREIVGVVKKNQPRKRRLMFLSFTAAFYVCYFLCFVLLKVSLQERAVCLHFRPYLCTDIDRVTNRSVVFLRAASSAQWRDARGDFLM